jgi:hypothetical protein
MQGQVRHSEFVHDKSALNTCLIINAVLYKYIFKLEILWSQVR